MRVQIGEKIKQLRTRDRRTQEMLASSIGVTSQAVSRWESGGGYPDMEIIPAIANYFHVSIDELFGYDGDREQMIQDIITETDAMFHDMRDLDNAVEILQRAAEEFPSELRIQLRLGNALVASGYTKHGARRSTPTRQEDGKNMVEYNLQNEDFAAALNVYEKILPEITDINDRTFVVRNMVRMYALRGEYKKAEELAYKQNPVEISRECLLSLVAEGEQRNRYEGEAMLALAWQMTNQILAAVFQRYDLRSSHTGIEKLLAMGNLYKSILEDGNYGFGHYALQVLYSSCARLASEQGLTEEAAEYLQYSQEQAKRVRQEAFVPAGSISLP